MLGLHPMAKKAVVILSLVVVAAPVPVRAAVSMLQVAAMVAAMVSTPAMLIAGVEVAVAVAVAVAVKVGAVVAVAVAVAAAVVIRLGQTATQRAQVRQALMSHYSLLPCAPQPRHDHDNGASQTQHHGTW